MIINVDIRNKSSLRMHSSVIIFEKVNECSCTTLLMNIIAAVVVVVVCQSRISFKELFVLITKLY